jgi:hypothetical protein
MKSTLLGISARTVLTSVSYRMSYWPHSVACRRDACLDRAVRAHVGCRGAQHGIAESGLAQQRDLRGVEFLAAEVLRIKRVRIDHNGIDAGAAEHRRRGRAGETASDDGNVRLPHAPASLLKPGIIANKRLNEA